VRLRHSEVVGPGLEHLDQHELETEGHTPVSNLVSLFLGSGTFRDSVEAEPAIRVWLCDLTASENDLPAAYRPLASYFDDEQTGSRTIYLAHIPATALWRGALGKRGPEACFFEEGGGFLGTDRVEVFPEPAGNGAIVVGGVGDGGAPEPDASSTTPMLHRLDVMTGERTVLGSTAEPASPEAQAPEAWFEGPTATAIGASPLSFIRIWACDTTAGRAVVPPPYEAFVGGGEDGASDTSYVAHVPASLIGDGTRMRAIGPTACFADFGCGLGLMGANACDILPAPHEDGRVVVGSCV
jgi:hypothetical protein